MLTSDQVVELWDAVNDYIPGRERLQAAISFLLRAEELGLDLSDPELYGHDKHLDAAIDDESSSDED